MNDLISRQWLMECVNERWIKFDTEKDENRFIHLVRDIAPSAQPEGWMERNKERILQAGMEGREIEFRIGGRLFAIREKAQ